jgi:hypothetical protein
MHQSYDDTTSNKEAEGDVHHRRTRRKADETKSVCFSWAERNLGKAGATVQAAAARRGHAGAGLLKKQGQMAVRRWSWQSVCAPARHMVRHGGRLEWGMEQEPLSITPTTLVSVILFPQVR